MTMCARAEPSEAPGRRTARAAASERAETALARSHAVQLCSCRTPAASAREAIDEEDPNEESAGARSEGNSETQSSAAFRRIPTGLGAMTSEGRSNSVADTVSSDTNACSLSAIRPSMKRCVSSRSRLCGPAARSKPRIICTPDLDNDRWADITLEPQAVKRLASDELARAEANSSVATHPHRLWRFGGCSETVTSSEAIVPTVRISTTAPRT